MPDNYGVYRTYNVRVSGFLPARMVCAGTERKDATVTRDELYATR